MRSSTTKLALLLSASLIVVSGCSKAPDQASAPPREAVAASDAATSTTEKTAQREVVVDPAAKGAPAAATADDKSPGITNDVAPGVAFAYRYAFTLPAKAISDMQRQHSDACRKLGPSQCRVTGMTYEQPKEGEVSARR